MDENENKDVEKVEEATANTAETVAKEPTNTQSAEPAKSNKGVKIAIISVIALIVVALVIVGIVAIVKNVNKPSKKQAEKVVEEYLKVVNDNDKDELVKLIDTDGYIILKEEKESKFDKKYKNKNSYIKSKMKDVGADDVEDLEKLVAKQELSSVFYPSKYEYSLKEIISVKKSEKSSKIFVIKAKVSLKDRYDEKETKTLTMQVIKVKGKYKVVGTKIA